VIITSFAYRNEHRGKNNVILYLALLYFSLESRPQKDHLIFYSIIGECNRGGQSRDSILSGSVLNQMVERRSPFNTRGEWFEVPEVTEGAENGRGTVRYGLSKAVDTELLNCSLSDPWRDEESRDTAT
jgi:hypothetical protein